MKYLAAYLFYFLFCVSALGQISIGPSQEISNYIRLPRFVKAHDIDGDEKIDVIAAESQGVRVIWWKNDGSGNFTKGGEWSLGDLDYEIIAIEDFNHDGHLDVWLYSDTRRYEDEEWDDYTISIAYGDASGGFSEPVVAINNRAVTSDLHIWDLNGDQHWDVYIGGKVYFADGSGGFHPAVDSQGIDDWEDLRKGIAVDLDEDGDREVIYENYDSVSGYSVAMNEGGGVFTRPMPFLSVDVGWEIEDVIPLHDAEPDSPPLILTLNSKSEGENYQYRLILYQQDIDKSYQKVSFHDLAAHEGDIKIQPSWLSQGRSSGRVLLRSYLTDTMFITHKTIVPSRVEELWIEGQAIKRRKVVDIEGDMIHSPFVSGDLSGDGEPDLVLPTFVDQYHRNTWGKLVWCHLAVDIEESSQVYPISDDSTQRHFVYLGDVDGDGDSDLLTHSRQGLQRMRELTIWSLNQSTGMFNHQSVLSGGDFVQMVEVIDVDGAVVSLPSVDSSDQDLIEWSKVLWPAGRKDFLIRVFRYDSDNSESGTLWYEVVLQGADGIFHRFPMTNTESVRFNIGEAYQPIYEDWDSDGVKDIIVQRDEGVFWMKGKGGSGLGWEDGILIAGSLTETVHFIDMDWDGDLDIFTKGNLFGALSSYWYANDGNGEISGVNKTSVMIAPLKLDVDQDGHEDFEGYYDRHVYWLSRPSVTFVPQTATYAQFYFDLDDDGDTDELFNPSRYAAGFCLLGWREDKGGLPPREFDVSDPDYHSIASAQFFAGRDQAKMGDVDGDGADDLVVVSSSWPHLEWFKIIKTEAPNAFDQWMGDYGLSGHSAGMFSDWDGDSILNWEEFAFGSSPDVKDPGNAVRPRLVWDETGLGYSYRRRVDASDFGLDYQHYCSDNLVDWSSWRSNESVKPDTDQYERVMMRIGAEKNAEYYKTKLLLLPTAQ